ncbi:MULTISPECIES: hypothetical protein [Hyphobacterium]|uniref:DUF3035 domain-containing protein n=1 Tax=Hyphobacterium vulgare TaxID=1736751 RepID=A0ABV6ZTB1_9PROT
MTRFFLLSSALLVAACATPDLPDGPDGAPQWYDEQLETADRTATAPQTIPSRSLDPAEDSRRAASMEDVLDARDALNEADRAQPVDAQTEAYANAQRPLTTPPDRDD